MATTVQEPNDIDSSEITDETIDNFALIVYEKSQTTAGLKQLALAGLKDFLNYNQYKADNIATLIGFEKDSGTDSELYDYNGDVDTPSETLVDQLQAVADQAGVTIHPSSGVTPLSDRIETLEDYVKDGWTDEDTSTTYEGLLDRVKDAESNISSLEEEIGSGTGSQSLTERISNAESSIESLQTTVGDSESGLVKSVSDINDEIGDEETDGTLKYRVKTNEDNISTLQTTVGDETSGLVKEIADINDEIGDEETEGTLTYRVKTNENEIETLKESMGSVYKLKGNVSSDTYSSWISGIADFENGWVWNATDSFEITVNKSDSTEYTIKVNAGENFAFVADTDKYEYGYFDQLGTTVDISELRSDVDELKTIVGDSENGLIKDIDDLQTTVGDETSGLVNEVNNLNARFNTSESGTWNSSTSITEEGTYIICGSPRIGGTYINVIFIGTFDSSGALITGSVVDITSNFETYFTIDNSIITSTITISLNSFRIGG